MSVIIRGMEMPKNCYECDFKRVTGIDKWKCCISKEVFMSWEAVRHSECPLIEIPPHGGWIPVTERLPECQKGAEVGNIEWISHGMVHAGCFGRGGTYRDAYFRSWTDAYEGIDAKDADYWRAVQIPEPPKEESRCALVNGK